MSQTPNTAKLVDGYKRAFVDSRIQADIQYTPQFINNSKGQKVLTAIESELKSCENFFISVAFITKGGITPLLGTLKELEEKGRKGKILTTDYLMFSDPEALDKLDKLGNIDLRVFKTGENNIGFHTKGYMFTQNGGNDLRIIVGSSNLTQDAITKNHEWNTKVVSTNEGEFAREIKAEFDDIWESSTCYSEYREDYKKIYSESRKEREEIRKLTQSLDLSYSQVLQPNPMQSEFVCNIEDIVRSGETKALLISATGTGKTYASAFAVRQLFASGILDNGNPSDRRALFLSHREQINKQALKSYKRVLGKNIPMGLLSGNYHDISTAKSCRLLFSTMNMMAKDEIRENFAPDYYSIIILDECHRSGANSYCKIIEYFKPKLLLGMSATPDGRGDNFDVYGVFDHNIACEVRLQQAIENEMLCPFHYFGIKDMVLDGASTDIDQFSLLTSDKRVEHIIEKAEYFGYSGNRVKGLIFCSRKEEAKTLSELFNKTGKYHTAVLSGDDSQEDREDAIDRLVNDDRADRLDYIFTVDIFNEGVDIPEINQVILLRQTESPIVFVQQLGRGLRKSDGKEFVVILDFIGDYNNNYMIPIALSGDRSGNKDNLRRSLMAGNNLLHGASTIYFDEVSRKRIYDSIDRANLNESRILKGQYDSVRFKLGRIPRLKEFDELGELDPLRIMTTFQSYQEFLQRNDKDYCLSLSNEEYGFLRFVSRHFASGTRLRELLLLKAIVDKAVNGAEDNTASIDLDSIGVNDIERRNTINILTNKFFINRVLCPGDERLQCPDLISECGNLIYPSRQLANALGNTDFVSAFTELIDFGIHRHRRDFSDTYLNSGFCLLRKYTYQQVCMLLDWNQEVSAQLIGGYKFDSHTNTLPVFINYEKSETPLTQNYEDRFIDPQTLIAISKSRRSLHSEDVRRIQRAKDMGIRIPLFVRKNKNDNISKEFYFLGYISHNGILKEFEMPGTEGVTAVEIGYRLSTPIPASLYDYITENETH